MQTSEINTPVSRGDFLRSLGLSSAALLSFYCLGSGLTACSSKSNDPTPATTPASTAGFSGNATLGSGTIDFTLDLTAPAYAKLTSNGGFIYQNDIVVARTNNGGYVALAKACTHQGTSVEYQPNVNNFYCPNHGSRFANSGSVLNGPAAQSLQSFKATLSTDGKQLRVTA